MLEYINRAKQNIKKVQEGYEAPKDVQLKPEQIEEIAGVV